MASSRAEGRQDRSNDSLDGVARSQLGCTMRLRDQARHADTDRDQALTQAAMQRQLRWMRGHDVKRSAAASNIRGARAGRRSGPRSEGLDLASDQEPFHPLGREVVETGDPFRRQAERPAGLRRWRAPGTQEAQQHQDPERRAGRQQRATRFTVVAPAASADASERRPQLATIERSADGRAGGPGGGRSAIMAGGRWWLLPRFSGSEVVFGGPTEADAPQVTCGATGVPSWCSGVMPPASAAAFCTSLRELRRGAGSRGRLLRQVTVLAGRMASSLVILGDVLPDARGPHPRWAFLT